MTGGTEHRGTGVTGGTPAEAFAALLERFAEELAFLKPGSPEGLLPLNALLMDLEQVPGVAADSAPAEALRTARLWMDALLDGDGLFSPGLIQNLTTWHDWFIDHLVAVETGRPHLPLPIQWREASTTPVDTPVAGSVPPAAPAVRAADAVASGPTFTLRLPEDIDLLREFHSESLELLRAVEASVLVLEADPRDSQAVNAIFRAFHTFKGSAGFLQLGALRDFAHELESFLDEVRGGRLVAGRRVIDAILAGADVLSHCVAMVGAQVASDQPVAPIAILSDTVRQRIESARSGEEPAQPQSAATVAAVVPAIDSSPAGERSEAFVRVDAGKLDTLVNLVGELVITQAFVLEHRDLRGAENLELGYAVRKLQRITRELQHTSLGMRMQPVANLFRKMNRLVRDLCASLGKQARLVVAGEETELDRHLVEQMADVLVHMIRNALDHGVETPAQRIAAGKDPVATIRLTASHAHGGVLVEVADDGRGIDASVVRQRAIERGLLAADAKADDQEVLRLIFLPGFTTAASVTDLSGRGVGMDVVKGRIDALRGHVDLTTCVGEGTTFALHLPLTLSQIDGFLVRVGTERFILPAPAVRECFRLAAGSLASVHERGEMVDVRGRQVPLIRLSSALCLRGASVAQAEELVVRVETSVGERAFLVDEVLGKQEVIIKNLGDTFAAQSLVTGGAILSDGRVALILDTEALARVPAGRGSLATRTEVA